MGFVRDLTGKTAANAAVQGGQIQAASAREAIEATEAASQRAQEFLTPFDPLVQRGIEGASFLADPQAQFNFLQENPLFQAALDNANRQTQQSAAARGRLSAGDTLQQLSENVLLSAQPLISQQRQDVGNLLNLASGLAQTRGNIEIGQGSNVGNLLTDAGAAQAAGLVGGANARTQGAQNLLNFGLQGTGLAANIFGFSDPRLKTNIKPKGKVNGFNWYSWDWNDLAKDKLGLEGSSEGVMADEIKETNPELIGERNGFMTVNYGGIH